DHGRVTEEHGTGHARRPRVRLARRGGGLDGGVCSLLGRREVDVEHHLGSGWDAPPARAQGSGQRERSDAMEPAHGAQVMIFRTDAVSGTTMREASERWISRASSIISSTARPTASGNFAIASWSVLASIRVETGTGPTCDMSWVCAI